MTKTTTQRVNEWRKRLALRASYFDDLNEDRIRRLGFDPADARPEYLAIRRTMEQHPRARQAPAAVEYSAEEGGWFIDFPSGARGEDMALAALAMRSTTSAPVFIRTYSDGAAGLDSAADVCAWPVSLDLAAEIAEMKRFGLWGAE